MPASLANYLAPEQILVGLEGRDKWEVMRKMFDSLTRSPQFRDQSGISPEDAWEALVQRERNQPTGIGDGVAFPHARLKGYRGLGVCLAILAKPVDFESIDGKPARFICMMLAAEERPALALKFYSKMGELLTDEATRKLMVEAPDGEAIYNYIQEKRIVLETSLLARDVMRKPILSVHPDTPLREVAHLMMRHRVEAAPVVDSDGRIVAEITCDHLFQYGIPEFFTQLQSVAFVSKFDPFEKYFADESKSVARDVMSSEFAALPEDSTMLEIVFALTVQKHPKVYVVRDGRCVGIIDRTTVLDRIFNF